MRGKLLGTIVVIAFTGCISRPKLDANRASVCVSETFAFAELRRGVENRLLVSVEAEDEDFIVLGVYEDAPGADLRLSAFRVGKDRRIWRQDRITADWRLIGMCD